jgi:hypothetical protein
MKKSFNNMMMKIMMKSLSLMKYYPFKWLGPVINKIVNWYMQKKFPTPKAQPAAKTPPPAEKPKS